ncbi:MAG: PDZ domain-containing protein [bacterium]|nr:PDZ domain-containing protein [bacterium]
MLDMKWLGFGSGTFAAVLLLVLGAAPLVGAPQQQGPRATPAGQQVMFFGGDAQQRSFLGVGVQEVDSGRAAEKQLAEERGVEITKVVPDSAAEKAGILKGDVVLDYNGQQVEGVEQFIRLVRETPVGRSVTLRVHRSGKEQTLKATIGTCGKCGTVVLSGSGKGPVIRIPDIEIPDINVPDVPRVFTTWRSSKLGIEAESLRSQLADFFGVEEGVLVRSVLKGSPADKAGFRAGDVILEVGGVEVASPREVTSAIREQDTDSFEVLVVRNRERTTLTVTTKSDGPGGEGRLRRKFFDPRVTSL